MLSETLKKCFIDRESVYASTAAERAAYDILLPIITGVQKVFDLGYPPIRFNGLPANQWLIQAGCSEAQINLKTFRDLADIINRK